ncbi:hypothetical protein KEM55_004815 [Ascosphaera atra]|nr:hypothetical protein KEM55_004815 [Ascosphaera atra]
MVALITGALSAISSPKLGAASDGHGRLTMLAVSVCGTLLGELTFLLMALYPHIFHLNILLLGAAFDGATGAVTCVLALSTSYATDCVSAERRNVAFGYFHGVLFGGLALGPFLGGMIIKQTGNPLYLFYASMVCYSIFLVFLIFIIPESLSKERQLENRLKHPVTFSFRKLVEELNPANFFRSLAIFSPKVSGSIDSKEKCILKAVKRNLFILAAVDTTVFGIKMGLSRIIIIYAEYLFGWGNVESSFFVSLISAVRVVMLLAALPAITRLVRGPKQGDQHVNTGCDMLDITIIRVSVFIDAAGYIGYACARTGSWLTVIGARRRR